MIHDPIITLFVIVSFLFTTIFIIKLYPLVYGKSIMPTGSKFFLFNYIIFIYIGVFLMNIFHFQKLEVADIYSTSLINNLLPMYILNIIMIPLFFIGALVSNTMFNINSTMNENKLLNNTEITNNSFYKSPFFIFITIGLLMIILIVLKIYSTKIDTIPIMGLFLDDVNNIGELRSDATNNFDGKKYRYNLILQTFPLFLFVFYFLLFNKKLFQKIIIIILFFLCMFTSIMDGVKSPLLQFFLLILLLIFFNNKKIPIKTIIIFSLVALLSMGLMYAFFMGMAGIY